MFDFNDAEQSKPRETLIPQGTAVPVHVTLRPGGAGDNGWLKRSNNGDAMMLDIEFTVIEGEYARRKVWSYFTVEGETEGQKKAIDITRSNIRGMLESARGINPSDTDEKAVAGRRLNHWGELDGLRCWIGVKVEKGKDGYKDKNQFSYAVTPDRKEWSKLDQGGAQQRAASSAPTARPAAAQSAPKASGGKPSWATGGSKPAQRQPEVAAAADLNDDIPF